MWVQGSTLAVGTSRRQLVENLSLSARTYTVHKILSEQIPFRTRPTLSACGFYFFLDKFSLIAYNNDKSLEKQITPQVRRGQVSLFHALSSERDLPAAGEIKIPSAELSCCNHAAPAKSEWTTLYNRNLGTERQLYSNTFRSCFQAQG